MAAACDPQSPPPTFERVQPDLFATPGAQPNAWADFDLDLFVEMRYSANRLYRNDGRMFVDIAPGLGMDLVGTTRQPAWVDYDNDGDLDLFIAAYGPDILWSNNGDGTFTDVTDPATLGADYHSTTAAWGDVDHDGLPDLVVTSLLSGIAEVEDHLFMNRGDGRFFNALPATLLEHGPSHGVAWFDFDRDGDLDLAIAKQSRDGRDPPPVPKPAGRGAG